MSNIALTLGGSYRGFGPKSDLSSWEISSQLESSRVSEAPWRVNHRVWNTLDNKGECIRREVGTDALTMGAAATGAPTKSHTDYPTKHPTMHPTKNPSKHPTKNPTMSPISPTNWPTTGRPTTSPTTSSPTTSPATTAPTSSPSKSPTLFPEHPDDGRTWAEPGHHCEEESCMSAPGIMFDIEFLHQKYSPARDGSRALAGAGDWRPPIPVFAVGVGALQFEHIQIGNVTVDVYTTDGPCEGREKKSKLWSKIATVDVNEADTFTEVELDQPVLVLAGRARGFYLRNTQNGNFFKVGKASAARSFSLPSTEADGDVNENEVEIRGGSVIFDEFGLNITGFDPTVQAGFSLVDPPTASPSTVHEPSHH